MPALPPIGAEIPRSMIAVNSSLTYQGTPHTLDFRGGIKKRVDVNPVDPINSVRLRTVGFRLTGEHDSLGTVTIEQNDIDADVQSLLTLTRQFPPEFIDRDVLSFSLTFGSDDEPIILTTREPMVLTAKLTQYPPRGDLYQLEKPVELVSLDDGDKVVAVLDALPLKTGGL
ncbi:hypothetical protein ACFO4E_24525 [Nocardiopsis mangrovi]|uniref:Uncharacterized protein n=1 Tax=Nocardiopsis mangrovi TaxID=1179818 RepID=A0ABV9E1K4_9ACTN